MAMYSYNSQIAECGVKELYLEAPIGATGAVGTVVRQQGFGAAYPANPRSLASIVRTGVGLYTVNFDQRWQSMIGFGYVTIGAPTGVGDGTDWFVTAVNLNVAQPNVTLKVVAYNSATTAADPTNPSTIQLWFAMKDSTV